MQTAAKENPGKLFKQAQLHFQKGQMQKAVNCISQACHLQPENAKYKHLFAIILKRCNYPGKALTAIAQCIALDPANRTYKNLFIQWIEGVSIQNAGDPLKKALSGCLCDSSLPRQNLHALWLSIITGDPAYKSLTNPEYTDFQTFTDIMDPAALKKAVNTDILLNGLPVLFAFNPQFEKGLTYTRHYLLKNFQNIDPGYTDFLAALALQCFHNEYVFSLTDEEKKLVEKLRAAVMEKPDNPGQIALLACYTPLYKLDNAAEMPETLNRTENKYYQELARRQIKEPSEEAEIARTIEAITPIKDSTSQAVRSQYEENPYPRWLSLAVPGRRNKNARAKYEVLDAGCGTGQAPISKALAFDGLVDITAIDLSIASLSYATRKAKELDLENIKFFQADILELDKHDEKYDAIFSGGVLHHMKEPLEGWRRLRDLLKPEGILRVALYSELARQNVVAARQYIEEHNLTSDAEDIRAFRDYVFTCKESDELANLTQRYDFYSLSNCRDLLFHVMEHRFTCPLIQEALDKLDMKFLGFRTLPGRVQARFKDMFPEPAHLTNLQSWHEFEKRYPDTFKSMYSVWCCRKDERPDHGLPAWLDKIFN